MPLNVDVAVSEKRSFELAEDATFIGTTSWRLKRNHIRFRGTNGEGNPLPAVQPIAASEIQIARFVAALDFLDVWSWKDSYNPEECGYTVCDGMSWSFKASIDGKVCNSSGSNAYPSFSDPQVASLDSERYGFLVFAFQSSFAIDFHSQFQAEQ